MLEIKNLHATIEGKEILKGINLTVRPGEVHAIMGPNGSGKSNILDSVLFALGLSGTRALRAENVSHLISTFNKRNEAYVKVTFSEVGDYGDFSVARRIRKA